MRRLIALLLLLSAQLASGAELVWRDASGNVHSLAEFQGRAVIVHIWASWCPACRQEMPAIDAWRLRHPDLPFLAISIDETKQAALAFLKAKAPHLKLNLATPATVAALGVRGMPATLFVAPNGKIAQLLHGALDWSGDAWLAELAALEEGGSAR